MTGWIIVLAVVLFFAVLLCSNITLTFTFQEGKPKAWVRYLFLRIALYPRPEKKKRRFSFPKFWKRKKKAVKQEITEEKPKKKKEKLSLDFILLLVKSGAKGVKILLRHLRIRQLKVRIVVGNEDAAECALLYGKICAILNGVMALAAHLRNIMVKSVDISCDFSKESILVEGSGKVKIRPIFILAAGISMLVYFVVNNSNTGNSQKERPKKAVKQTASAG